MLAALAICMLIYIYDMYADMLFPFYVLIIVVTLFRSCSTLRSRGYSNSESGGSREVLNQETETDVSELGFHFGTKLGCIGTK